MRLMWPFIDRRERLGLLKGEGFYALLLILSGMPRTAMCPTPDKYWFITAEKRPKAINLSPPPTPNCVWS